MSKPSLPYGRGARARRSLPYGLDALAGGSVRSNLRLAAFMAQNAFHAHVELRDGRKTCLARLLERHARERGTRVALRFEERTYTYAQLNQEANRVASTLAELGAKRGDVIALLMSNRPEYLFTIIGANKLGVAVALVDASLAGDALAAALSAEAARFLLVGGEHASTVERLGPRLRVPRSKILVQRERDGGAPLDGALELTARLREAPAANRPETSGREVTEVCVHICTSGTTGPARRVRMTNARMLRAARFFESAIDLTSADVVYDSGMPLHHASGLIVGFAAALAAGATFAMRRKFSASQHWDDIARFDATVFTYVGELCRYLLASPPHPLESAHRVRTVMGAGLGLDAWEPFQRRFGISSVCELYGATDGNVGLVNLDGRPGMLGRLLPGQIVVRADASTGRLHRDARGRLVRVEPGEAGMLLGGCDRASSLRADVARAREAGALVRDGAVEGPEYFCTGDLVRLHAQRYVSFVDRVGDAVVWNGEHVSTVELTEVLHGFPGVREVNVYGVEVDGVPGKAPMAALVVGEAFRVEGLADFVAERLPANGRPVFLRICSAIETTGTHTQVKTRLREEGYHPDRVGGDPVYRYDSTSRGYARLTATQRTAHERLAAAR